MKTIEIADRMIRNFLIGLAEQPFNNIKSRGEILRLLNQKQGHIKSLIKYLVACCYFSARFGGFQFNISYDKGDDFGVDCFEHEKMLFNVLWNGEKENEDFKLFMYNIDFKKAFEEFVFHVKSGELAIKELIELIKYINNVKLEDFVGDLSN